MCYNIFGDKMKISILGTGAYGLALASIFEENKNNVVMWTKFEEEKNELILNRFTPKLPGFILPKDIEITTNFDECILNSDLIVIAVPTAFVNDVSIMLNKKIKNNQHICIASKGIEQNSCKFVCEVVENNTNSKNIGIISGPSFAVDVVKKVPIGLSVGSKNNETIKIIKKTLENNHLKLRETNDVIGIEVCGATKNIIAIAAGIVDGMNLPISTKAFLITEALNDIKVLIDLLNGDKKTILSFAGFGDILLTCTSEKSRNYSFGKLIGKGTSKKEIQSYLKTTTVEGAYTLKSIRELIKSKKIELPIIEIIYNIVFKGKNPNTLIKFLIKK